MTLRFDRVTAHYGGRQVFRAGHFTLAEGELLGLIGPNGAGKTTLLRIAAGLIRPSKGVVTRTGRVMYFGGEATLPGGCRADSWARLFGAKSRERRPFRRLSRGSRQLEGLLAVLAGVDWRVGLLDEPWEGLDPNGARWLAHELGRHRERGASVIVSSHRLHDISELCTSFAFLANGELRLLSASELAASNRRLGAGDLEAMFDGTGRA